VTGPNNGVARIYRQFNAPHWEDLQGLVRLEMIQGSVGIESITVDVTSKTNRHDHHRQTFTNLSPVPVPAAAWLFGTALFGLVGFSKRRKAA
jgi:hypothetical protein